VLRPSPETVSSVGDFPAFSFKILFFKIKLNTDSTAILILLTLNYHTSPESHSCHIGTSQTPAIKTLTAKKLLTFFT